MMTLYQFRLRIIIPLIVCFFFVLASVLFLTKQIVEVKRDAVASIRASLGIQMYKLQNSLGDLLALDKEGLVDRQVSQLALDPKIKVFLLLDENGIVKYSNRREWLGAKADQVGGCESERIKALVRHLKGEIFLEGESCFKAYYPVVLGLRQGEIREERIGCIYTYYDFSHQVRQATNQVFQNGVLYCVSGFLFAILLSFILYQIINRRLDRINRGMQALSEGELSTRLRFAGKDEIAILATGFDEMAEKLEKEREALVLMRFMVEHSADAILLIVPDGHFHYVNDAACRMLAYPHDEMLKLSIENIDINVTHEKWDNAWVALSALGSSTFESHYVTKNGNLIDVEICTNFFSFRDKEYNCAVVRDITDRKKVENDLHLQNEEYAALNEAYKTQNEELKTAKTFLEASEAGLKDAQQIANMGNWELDLETDKLYWSDQVFRIFGFQPQDFKVNFSVFLSCIHPDDVAFVDHAYQMHLKEKTPYSIEHRIILPNGSIRYLNQRCRTIHDENGKPLRSLGTIIDISERVYKEEELRKSREQFELAINGSHDGIWDWDLKTNIVFFSKRWKEQIGYAEDEFPNKYEAWESHLHPEDKLNVLSALNRYLKGESASYNVEFRLRHKNGGFEWILARGEASLDQNDKPVRMVGSHTIISERKQIEKELVQYREHLEDIVKERTAELEKSRLAALSLMQDANREKLRAQSVLEALKKNQEQLQQAKLDAEKANQTKSEFLSNMSHELRTPLNAILGFSKMLRTQKNITDQQKSQLLTINNCGEHLLSLINDILDMSKIEAQKLELTPSEVNLPLAIQTIFNINRIKADEKDLEYSYRKSDTLPNYVFADERKLKQIMLNLVNNAIKFTDSGSVRLNVDYKLASRKFIFEVTDSGIGIPMEMQKDIFEPFVQFTGERLFHEGTGLGLSITRELVGMMDGEITLISSLGTGSTFRVEIPLEKVNDAKANKQTSEMELVGYEGEKKKILIVDDNQTNVSLLVSLLEPLQFELETAENGASALVTAKKFRPHLILLDYRMPVMDGITFGNILKSDEQFKYIKVMGVSATVQQRERLLAFKDVCHDFIVKPVDIDQFFIKIKQLLGIEWIVKQSKPDSSNEGSRLLVFPERDVLTLIINECEIGDYASASCIIEKIKQSETFVPFCSLISKYLNNYDFDGVIEYIRSQDLV